MSTCGKKTRCEVFMEPPIVWGLKNKPLGVKTHAYKKGVTYKKLNST